MKILIKLKQFFSKFSLFDFLSVLVGLFLLLALVFFLFRKTQYVDITVRVTNGNVLWGYTEPRNEFARLFREGMMKKDGLGRKEIEVLKVQQYALGPESKVVFLDLKIRSVFDKKNNQYSYNGLPILIGSPLLLQLDSLRVESLVTDIAGQVDKRSKKELVLKTRLYGGDLLYPGNQGVPKYYVDAINVGEKVKDFQGNVVIEIIDKKVEPATQLITDYKGNMWLGKSLLNYDVYLTLKVSVTEEKGEFWLMDSIRLQIGGDIPIVLGKTTIYPTITEMDYYLSNREN